MLTGPYCTTLLGDMGADVIKVERPGRGDGMRHTDREYPGGNSSYFLGVNRSKRSVTIDIRSPEGRDLALALIGTSSVVVENMRPGKLAQLGLGYQHCAEVNPAIVYCSISAFGTDGPLVSKPGMDLVVQAMSGMMGHTGEPGRPPVRLAPSLADFGGALFSVYGILAALRVAERTGEGQEVNVSLLEGQLALLSNYIPHLFATGEPSGPVGVAHPQLVPYQIFSTADGYLIVACLTNRFWRQLCKAIDRPELIDDERFRENPDRLRHRDELIPMLSEVFARHPVSHWTEVLDAADVPNAPILRLAAVVEHPQVRHLETIVRLEHPEAGSVPVVTNPARLSKTPARLDRVGPSLSEGTDEVLKELGVAPDRIADLRERGVV